MGVLYGLALLGAALYIFVPWRSLRKQDPFAIDGPEVRTIWATACYLAGDAVILPEHVLLAALPHRGVAQLLTSSVEDVRAKLLASIASGEERETDTRQPKLSHACVKMYWRARHEAQLRREKTMVRDLVDALRRVPGVLAEVLPKTELGTIERRHPRPKKTGTETPTPYRSAGALVDVYANNDDKTNMDFVMTALRDDFGLPTADAVYAMYETHYCGIAYVGTWPLEEAKERIARVEGRARNAGLPFSLRLDA